MGHYGIAAHGDVTILRELVALRPPPPPFRAKTGKQEDNKPKKNEEILYATIDHTNPSASNEEHTRSDNTCEYAVINYNCKQETTTSEQDTQEYEEVIPN
uniref:uncharacterized protein isoform X1 n=1 Tax=Pristiophorus japonicus TaxID=55135 RepID=UPI00398EEBF8